MFESLSKGDMFNENMLVGGFSIGVTKRGTKYCSFNAKKKEFEINCKVWDSELASQIEGAMSELTGKVVTIKGKVDEYQGSKQLIVDNITLCHDFEITDYVESVDIDAVYNEFVTCINSMLTPKGLAVVNGIFKYEGDIFKEKFKKGYAASSHHDNKPGGLMNHTVKVVKIVDMLIKLEGLEEYRDLLIIGALMHDIGKIKEIHNGEYTKDSFVTHRLFGIELMFKYKKAICSSMGESFYYRLLSIIQTHHGQWGEPCNTIYAKIVHLADYIESNVCGIVEDIKEHKYISSSSGNYMKDENGWKLYI